MTKILLNLVDSFGFFLLNSAMFNFYTQLKKELITLGKQGAVFLVLITIVLSVTDNSKTAVRFFSFGLITWLYVLKICHSKLSLNYDSDSGTQFHDLGFGNRVTLLRGLLISATAGFLGSNQSTVSEFALFSPAVFYTVAAIGDALDGYIARVTNQTSHLGRELDNALDALGLLIAPALAVLWGKLEVWYLGVSISYYIFRLGVFLRTQANLPVYPLPPNPFRRRIAGYQMGIVATSLWAPVPAELTRPIGTLLMVPLLVRFILDWLHVSGHFKNPKEQT